MVLAVVTSWRTAKIKCLFSSEAKRSGARALKLFLIRGGKMIKGIFLSDTSAIGQIWKLVYLLRTSRSRKQAASTSCVVVLRYHAS